MPLPHQFSRVWSDSPQPSWAPSAHPWCCCMMPLRHASKLSKDGKHFLRCGNMLGRFTLAKFSNKNGALQQPFHGCLGYDEDKVRIQFDYGDQHGIPNFTGEGGYSQEWLCLENIGKTSKITWFVPYENSHFGDPHFWTNLI